jgi:hypothetical protein
LHGRQLLVGIPLARDELLADFGRRQPAIQPGGLEGGVGLEVFGDEIAHMLEEVGQVEFAGLATAGGEVVEAGDAGVQLMQGLADGIVSPTQLALGLPLAQAEGLHRFGHVAPPLGSPEGISRFLQQSSHRFGQFHVATPPWEGWHCTDFQRADYFPVFALKDSASMCAV